MKKLAVCVIAVTLFALGIVHAQATKNPGNAAKPLARGKIRFTPVDLFPGDLKRLRTHLEMEGACFKFEYDGPKKSVHFVLQILEKEQPDQTLEVMYLEPLDGRSSGEVSVSIRNVKDAQGQSAWHMITQVEGMGFAATRYSDLTPPKMPNGSSRKSIREVTDFDVNDEVALWCNVKLPSGVQPFNYETVDEMTKWSRWAVVLKLVPGGRDDVD